MPPRTIFFKLYSLFWTINRKDFENRKDNKKVTAKGPYLILTPSDPLFFRIFFPGPFQVCALGPLWQIQNIKIFSWKLFEKTLHAWIQFNIQTPIDNFHRLIKPEVLNTIQWNLEYILITSIWTIPIRLRTFLSFSEFFIFSSPLFSSLRPKISKLIRDRNSPPLYFLNNSTWLI